MLRGDGFQFRRGVSSDKQGLSAGLNGGLGFCFQVVFLHPACGQTALCWNNFSFLSLSIPLRSTSFDFLGGSTGLIQID